VFFQLFVALSWLTQAETFVQWFIGEKCVAQMEYHIIVVVIGYSHVVHFVD
jgi:hypothetical protein